MANIKIFALGGQDEKGKSSYVINVNEEHFLVDCGVKVPPISTLGIDLVIPNFSYIKKNIHKFKGVFISQAQDNSFAALPWLLMQTKGLKIYGSQYTIDLIKERVSKYKIPHSNYEFCVINGPIKFKHVTVTPFDLAMSIHGGLGYSFNTEDGAIVYMTGFAMGSPYPEFGKTNLHRINEIAKGNIHSLLLDSSRANYKTTSEDKVLVRPFIESFFKKTKNDSRIIIGAYDEKSAILFEIIQLASEYKRPVINYGRAFATLYNEAVKTKLTTTNAAILPHTSIQRQKNAVILVTGTGNRVYKRFQRITAGDDVFLKYEENDSTIIITPPINGQERMYTRMMDAITQIAPRLFEVPEKKLYGYHPTFDDIQTIVKTLKPRYLLPISALYRYLIECKRAADKTMTNTRKVILQNGKVFESKDGKYISENQKAANVIEVLIDGFGVGDVSSSVVRERENLSKFGVIQIAIPITRKKEVLKRSINIQMSGVINLKLRKDLLDILKSHVIQICEDQKEQWDVRAIQEKVRKKLRKVVNKEIGKEPIIIPIVVDM